MSNICEFFKTKTQIPRLKYVYLGLSRAEF